MNEQQGTIRPYLSPLNGDFSKGFPPAILTTGTRDMLLSDTVLLRRAGIPAELHITEAAGHGGFLGMAPENQEILREVRRFPGDALEEGVAMNDAAHRGPADPLDWITITTSLAVRDDSPDAALS